MADSRENLPKNSHRGGVAYRDGLESRASFGARWFKSSRWRSGDFMDCLEAKRLENFIIEGDEEAEIRKEVFGCTKEKKSKKS